MVPFGDDDEYPSIHIKEKNEPDLPPFSGFMLRLFSTSWGLSQAKAEKNILNDGNKSASQRRGITYPLLTFMTHKLVDIQARHLAF